MSYTINAMRADRAAYALDAGRADEVCDLLTDLMHYCDVNSLDFDAELATARMHYSFEIDPDDIEEVSRLAFATEGWE